MIYLSHLLGTPIIDADDQRVGLVSDLAVSTNEVFPRVVAVAFKSADKTPRIISLRRYVATATNEEVRLSVPGSELEYSYLKEDELLLARDLLNKQIVDVQGKKVVKVTDLKLSDSGTSLRLLGAEYGLRGRLQFAPPLWANFVTGIMGLFGKAPQEQLIAWNYIDLPGRDLSQMKLSVSHKRLHELHPADVADIIEQLDPEARAAVFAHLDKEQAADTISEMEDEYQADVIEDLPEPHASDLLAEMDPDDAADIIADLDYSKAERLLRLMGIEDSEAIRGLLGYPEKTAGGIMTPEVAVIAEDSTVAEARDYLRSIAHDADNLHYVYLLSGPVPGGKLVGVVSMFELLVKDPDTRLNDFATRDLFAASPEDDQEDVAEMISKYNLLALPIVDKDFRLLGTVTIDDAVDVLEEEAEEDLARATGRRDPEPTSSASPTLIARAGRALRWCLPQNVSWVVIWTITSSAILYFSTILSIRAASGIADTDGFYALDFGFYLLLLLIPVLPLALTTIRSAVLKAIEVLTDLEPDLRPRPPQHYLAAAGIGLVSALLLTGITTLFAASKLEVFLWNETLLLFIPLALTSLITSQIIARLVNRAVRADDAGRDISPSRIAASGMVIYLALLFLTTILATYNAIQLGLF
jgi:CBS domain-containing protein/sporulation protein YlmC with PRC-barrel domain